MFEKVVIRKAEDGPPVTIGAIAEAMLFYQNVHIILEPGNFKSIIDRIGMEQLINLLKLPNISAAYCEEFLGIRTQKVGVLEEHSYITGFLSGDDSIGRIEQKKDRLVYLLSREGYSARKAEKLTEQFWKLVPFRSYAGDHYVQGGIAKAAYEDLQDTEFVQMAIMEALGAMIGYDNIDDTWKIELGMFGDIFRIYTNIPFGRINRQRTDAINTLEPIKPVNLLTPLIEARADLVFSSHYGGDFHTAELSSRIIRIRHKELLRRTDINNLERQEFEETVLSEMPSIREVIDSGEKTINEFYKIYERSDRFRRWIQSVNPDRKLIAEYISAIASERWAGKLPVKTVRYMLCTIAGIINVPAGIALSAVDSLVLDRMIKGWRPSHFIEKRLKPFLDRR